jgi:hypothetical protein
MFVYPSGSLGPRSTQAVVGSADISILPSSMPTLTRAKNARLDEWT